MTFHYPVCIYLFLFSCFCMLCINWHGFCDFKQMELCQFTPFLSLSLNLLIKTRLGLHCLLYLYLIKNEIKQDLTVLSQEMNSAVWHLHFRIHLAIQFLFCLTVLLFYKRHLRWRHVYMFRPCEGLSTGSNNQCMYFIFFF